MGIVGVVPATPTIPIRIHPSGKSLGAERPRRIRRPANPANHWVPSVPIRIHPSDKSGKSPGAGRPRRIRRLASPANLPERTWLCEISRSSDTQSHTSSGLH